MQSSMEASVRYDDSPEHNGSGVQPLLFHRGKNWLVDMSTSQEKLADTYHSYLWDLASFSEEIITQKTDIIWLQNLSVFLEFVYNNYYFIRGCMFSNLIFQNTIYLKCILICICVCVSDDTVENICTESMLLFFKPPTYNSMARSWW